VIAERVDARFETTSDCFRAELQRIRAEVSEARHISSADVEAYFNAMRAGLDRFAMELTQTLTIGKWLEIVLKRQLAEARVLMHGKTMLQGRKNIESYNAARRLKKEAEHQKWRDEARRIRKAHPRLKIQTVAQRVKDNLGLEEHVETIRRALKKK